MQIKLIPNLRLLNPSVPVSRFFAMKPSNPFVKPSRGVPILSRVFPHRLRYQAFSKKPEFCQLGLSAGVRKLSTHSSRSGPGIPASKSLIEDEAELSDWVSGLKSDSLGTKLYSDRDDAGADDFGSGRGGERRGGREESGGKRRRESDSGGYNDSSNRRKGSRDSIGSFPRNSRGKGRFTGEFGRKDEGNFSRRIENGLGGGRDDLWKGNGRGSQSSYGGDQIRGRGGGGRGSSAGGFEKGSGSGRDDLWKGNGRGSQSRYGGDQIRGRGGGGRGSSAGGRGSESRYQLGGDRGTRIVKNGLKTRRFMTSDEDEDDEIDPKSISRQLISEEDSEEIDDEIDDDEEEDEDVEDVLKKSRTGNGSPVSSGSSPGKSDSYLSETRFDQCSVSPLSLKGIKDAGYEKMTVVQEATLPLILKGKDVLAKAKTGTGKTVAFLLPAIEAVVKSPPIGRDQRFPPVLVLVICPTRELASQAAAEANKLVKYHPSIGVQVVIGGTRLAVEQRRLQANPCQILVATPGRLRDHTENTAGFATKLMGVRVLVLDEADHLLDMGFRKDIEKIVAAVPKQRQTLLFSATIPPEVRQISHIALKRDHEFVNTVQEGSEETHTQVKQTHLVAPLAQHFSLLYVLLKDHIADDVDYKVLVFCTTAMVTRLVANLLSELNLNVREIHSRKPQSYRTRVSEEFRKSKGLILVTSDVSARGVDYPDVTLVIQIGLPSDRQQYIHRLGRTGRKGKEGQGILLLAPWEEFFLSSVKDLPITKASMPSVDPDTRKKVERALSHAEMKNKEAAYQAWLGYYNSNKTVARDKAALVQLANDFSRSMGLDNPPAIPKLVLGKMGLKNVPGLRVK